MTNSSLVVYTKISPCSNPRKNKILKITPHHMAGNLTIEQCGEIFASIDRQGSSNYGIGSDGRVGMYVEEKNRAWTSSNAENDHMAVTIEVANDVIGGDWHVSDKALASLIDLCVDICKRNGIERLNFTGDENGNLTMHKYFAATACPGAYLESKFPYIANEVNKRLISEEKENKNMRFKDVPETHWAYKAIEAIAERGVVNGYENGTFIPEGNVTRAEIAVILSRLDSRYNKDHKYLLSMSDVSPDAWYTNEVNFCIETGLLIGYPDATFRPDEFVTRAEIATILVKFMEVK